MDTVIFSSEGILIEKWNPETQKRELFKIDSTEAFGLALNYVVEFEPNFTLEQFINLIEPFQKYIDLVFLSANRGFKLEPYIQDMRTNQSEQVSDVDYLEFYWCAEAHPIEEDSSELEELIEYGSYHGINLTPENDPNNPLGIGNYALSYNSLATYKHLPIKINSHYRINPGSIKKNLPLFEGIKYWRLYDVLFAFIYELTFHGYPYEAQTILEDLRNVVEEIRNQDL